MPDVSRRVPTTIERSVGVPLKAGHVVYGMAGGGWSGITAALDDVVLQAAEALAGAYGKDIEIRFNSDRHSGGAWLRTPDGQNSDVGIGAKVITEWTRRNWENRAQRYEAEAAGKFGQLDLQERGWAREKADVERRSLARFPEGLLTVYAHIAGSAVLDPQQGAALVGLGYWNAMGRADDYRAGYHHDSAESVEDALTRCLRFVPRDHAR